MKYIDCLNHCIDHAKEIHTASDYRMAKKLYRSYPIPSEKEWLECLKLGDTYPVCGGGVDACFLDYMAQYEWTLCRNGVSTVSEKRTVANLMQMIVKDGVNLRIIFETIERLADGTLSTTGNRVEHHN